MHRRVEFSGIAFIPFVFIVAGGAPAFGGPCSTHSDCDDSVACTIDQCIGGDCFNTPDNVACDNGLFCDGPETCDAVMGCQSGAPIDCAELDGECVAGFCDDAADD